MIFQMNKPLVLFSTAVITAFAIGNGTSVSAHSKSATAVGFRLLKSDLRTLPDSQLRMVQNNDTPGTISRGSNSIFFRQHSVKFVIDSGPANDMLSYRINGLRNPTIVVARGATLRIAFVNRDDDMLHNIRFGKKPGNMAAISTVGSVGTAMLPHKQGKTFSVATVAIEAPTVPGQYAYFCTVRGHAFGGMMGNIRVN